MDIKGQPIILNVSGDKGVHHFSIEVESDAEIVLPVKGSCGCIVFPSKELFCKVGTNSVNATFIKSYCPTDCLTTVNIGGTSVRFEIKR